MTEKRIQGKANLAAPYEPCLVTPADIHAINALVSGKATEDQQIRVVKWLEQASGVGEMSYRPSERDTAFAEGKRFVGLQFFTLAKTVVQRD